MKLSLHSVKLLAHFVAVYVSSVDLIVRDPMINSDQRRSMTKEEKDEKFAKIWFQALARFHRVPPLVGLVSDKCMHRRRALTPPAAPLSLFQSHKGEGKRISGSGASS